MFVLRGSVWRVIDPLFSGNQLKLTFESTNYISINLAVVERPVIMPQLTKVLI